MQELGTFVTGTRLEFCGRADNPGFALDKPELIDWSRNPPSVDQRRIVDELFRMDVSAARILHVGVGCSGLASRLAHRCRWIDGLTVHVREREFGHSLGLPNYRVLRVNKYSMQLASLAGTYDFIVDNNPGSYACCMHHFHLMWNHYCDLLKPGGRLLTDERGLAWTPAGNEAWSMSLAELGDLCTRFPLAVSKITETVYALERR
jgi:hypothetical protein